MTLTLIMEALEEGKIQLTDSVSVSEYAASMGGSQVFLEPNETQTVDTMIKCISIASANDAAVAMAEKIAGSEPNFVKKMNEKAKELLGKTKYDFADLCRVMEILRGEGGCPWDREQTHESIRKNFIEETYEVIEAIDQDDPEMLREELGDLLLQVVFHTRIETEQEHFTLEDVCTDICNKLIVRHPHVFSTVQADTTEEVLKNWDAIKEETKHQTTRTQTLEAVAKTLPALMRAQKVCKRAMKDHNRFLCNESALASVTECKHTLEEAMHMEDPEQITRAMGELLFCCAGMAQTLGLSAEQVLTDTTNQFISCFRVMEETCAAENRPMETLSNGEWNALWKKTRRSLEEED